ncbi:vegetative incompatibility protein HET-E-1 [Diaporthe sp. PMI_573]|nr:vegetative incompatibility protein HET-E-1 [Diaporthaceae sp. PMI_573]
MRLLKYSPDGELAVTENLPDNENLNYAILSHTWESEEVTFEDLKNGVGKNKAGFQKIRFCAEQAKSHGCQHFWVDTCCIDKSNHVELNEAIISMFRWYRNAASCYVYLSDVSVASCGRKRKRKQSEPWERAFRDSRWFKRGWTLQELLAPASVEFFTREGQRLGDKKSLEQPIHEITKIAMSALRGTDLSQFDVDERFKWAESRETTREEDWAYCQLGIFGVSMPALYGEGRENAIRRLKGETSRETSSTLFVHDKLPAADGAAFDSQAEDAGPTCHRDTRVDLLRRIRKWADQPGDQPQTHAIFWLNGMAGTGKSTISRTVARHFADRRRLGASFFFKRGDGDRGKVTKFFTTIAAQLVSAVPGVAAHVKNAIESDPSVVGKAMREQFEKLIFEPLSRITPEASQASGLVIVVDALDECERDDDVKLIINLFSRAKSLASLRLRILVTSRPELPIRLGFSAIHGKYQDLVLHEIPEPVVEQDISAYLQSELARIRDEYNASVSEERQLASSWPDQSTIQILVKMAVPLFIFAATVCRFLADRKCGNPDKKLKTVLEYRTKSQESKLDNTYLPVLEQLLVDLSGREKAQVLDQFRMIIGSIVILASPLSTHSLARMLGMSTDTIDDILDWLHSVLSIPSASGSPVRLLHLSFRDFLLDPEKRETNPFWVDEQQTHERLAAHCLRVMSGCLRTDICGLQAPGTPRSTISPKTVEASLPSEVQYACLYWVYHVEQSQILPCDGDQVHDFLYQYFLQWLEALSIIGRVSESIRIIKTLQSLVKILEGHSDSVCSVAFSPDLALVASGSGDKTVRLWRCDTGACVQELKGHSNSVSSVAFSPNSALVASGSGDKTVRLWHCDIGTCVQELKGHSNSVSSIAFSPNSVLVASGSYDKTVRLWCCDTGACIQELKGHSGSVSSVMFSPDSVLVASGSYDKTVRLWCYNTGMCMQELKGHSDSVSSIAFSPNLALVASGSYDKIVRLWRCDMGMCVQELKGHSDSVSSVTFSPNSALVASGSYDETVRLWRCDTGACVQELKGHSNWISSVAFSPNSALVASGSGDKTVRLWRCDTGTYVQELKGHSDSVSSVTFSPDLALVASGSHDKTVWLWRCDTGACVQKLKGHSNWVSSIAFSPDLALVASGSGDKTVRLWRCDTGACVQELKGHSSSVSSVAFSPDSALVASGSYDETVRLWRCDTGAYVQELKGHSDSVSSVAFSPDSALVASGSYDETVRLWRCDTGACVQEENMGASVTDLSFEPDGSRLLTSLGAIALLKLPFVGQAAANHVSAAPVVPEWRNGHRVGYGFSRDRSWITWHGHNLLWLPAEFRPDMSAVSGCTVVIGCSSGRVIFIRLSFDST